MLFVSGLSSNLSHIMCYIPTVFCITCGGNGFEY